MGRIRRRRPESTVPQFIAELREQGSTALARADARTRRARRESPGAIIGHYDLPNPNGAPVSVVAAAQPMFGRSVTRTPKRPATQGWQKESWQLRNEIGEFRFSGDRVARAVSQMRLYPAKVENLGDEPTEVTEGPAFDLCGDLFGNQAATQQGLRRAAQHLTFTGESMFVISQTENAGYEWMPRSTTELTSSGTSWKLNDGVNQTTLDNQRDAVVRCWTPDPELSALPDAPSRAVLPVARELKGLTEHVSAQIDSRLAGAGILFLSEGLTVAKGQIGDADGKYEDEDDLDPLVRDLMDMMITPVKDRNSAAALVPFVVKGSPDDIAASHHMKLHEPLDPKAKELREEAIRRVALGMDSPPEALLGLSGGNHWQGWQVAEEEVTLVVSPITATICHAVTTGFYQDALRQMGVPDADKYLIWFDPSGLQLRPDKSSDSRDLFDKGALSEQAMLRENGFGESDMPTDEEKKIILLTKLLIGAPSLAPLLLPLLGIEVDASVLNTTADIAEAAGGSAPTGGASTPPPPAEPPAPSQGPPAQDTTPPATDNPELQ